MYETGLATERTTLPSLSRHPDASGTSKDSHPFAESQHFEQWGTSDTETRPALWGRFAKLARKVAQACRDLSEDTQPSGDWLRSIARLIIQACIVVVGMVVFNQVLLLGMLGWLGDTTTVRTGMLIFVVLLYTGIYQATSVRHRRIPAAWSSVALVLVELSMLAVMFPFLVLLVQKLVPAGVLRQSFESNDDWAGPAIFIFAIFIGTRGWTRYMQRAAQATQTKATADIFERLALEDSLTGLPNRRSFEACIGKWLAPTSLACQNVSLLLIDVNRFKSINDGYSHNTGDAVLRHIAQVLKSTIAVGDMAARLAGDEFVVVLRGLSDAQAGAACRLLAQAVADFEWGSIATGLTVSISVGHAAASPGDTIPELLRRSDEQMYRAKRSG